MKRGRAKRLVMQRQYRMRVERNKTRYSRKAKHRKASGSGGFSVAGLPQSSASSLSIMARAWPM